MKVDEYSSYDDMMLIVHSVDDCEQQYIAECLYSLHHRGQFYLSVEEELFRAMSEFCVIHFRKINLTKNAFGMTYTHAEFLKSKKLQQRLHSTAFSPMGNLRKDHKET